MGVLHLPDLAHQGSLLLAAGVVVAHDVGDLGQVAGALGRHYYGAAGGVGDVHGGPGAVKGHPGIGLDATQQGQVQGGDPVVVELAGDGAVHRHFPGVHIPGVGIALHLLAHVPQGVFRAAPLEFVHRHQVGEIQHVDFFQLAGRAELGGHHVEAQVGHVHHRRVALANACGFDQDQVIARGLAHGDHVAQGPADLHGRASGGQGAQIDVGVVQAVHADAVAQQGPTALAPGGIHADHGHLFLGKVLQEAQQQLIGERRFARAAGAGYAHHGHWLIPKLFGQPGAPLPNAAAFQYRLFHQADGAGHHLRVLRG